MNEVATVAAPSKTAARTATRFAVPPAADGSVTETFTLSEKGHPVVPKAPPANGAGLVIVAFDGVSSEYLKQAVADGKMPELASLIKEQGYTIQHYFAGVPNTTPVSFAGLLYGARPFPGYRFYDKSAGQARSADNAHEFHEVFEKGARDAGHCGLAGGGVMAGNLFSGGADKAYLTIDQASQHENEQGVAAEAEYMASGIGQYARQHPLAFGRSLGQFVRDGQRFYRMPGEETGVSKITKALTQAGETGLFGDAGAAIVTSAMKNDAPIIISDNTTYDGMAHRCGPEGHDTDIALKRMDRAVKKIMAEATATGHRPYEVVFISDHGNTASNPFVKVHGKTLASLTSELAGGAPVQEAASGSLDHVYFTNEPKQLTLEQIQAKFPGTIDKLVAQPGIGLLLGRTEQGTVILGKGGHITIEEDGKVTVTGKDPLAQYDVPRDVVLEELARMAQHEHSGDLIALGEYDPSTKTAIDFEDHGSGHGGLGGRQTDGMFMAGPSRNFDLSGVRDPADLHWFLESMRPADANAATAAA